MRAISNKHLEASSTFFVRVYSASRGDGPKCLSLLGFLKMKDFEKKTNHYSWVTSPITSSYLGQFLQGSLEAASACIKSS